MSNETNSKDGGEQSVLRRMDNALKRALAMPHQPHKPAGGKKAKPKPRKREPR